MGRGSGGAVRLVQDEVCVLRVTFEINRNVRAGRDNFDVIVSDDVHGTLDEFGSDAFAAHGVGDICAVDVVDGIVLD